MRQPRIIYKVICKECGKDIPKDKDKSNHNWIAYKEQCEECGGRTKMTIA